MSSTPGWLKAGLLISGLAVILSGLRVLKSPTSSPLDKLEGLRRRRGKVGRILDTPEDVSRYNIETGWHWFARRYPDGRWSKVWRTTRDAARRGLQTAHTAELWGYDKQNERWVKDAPFRAGRYG